jgi:predicted Zn-dependent protease with MMP-like domain
VTHEEFEELVAQEFEHAIPEKFREHIKNVAFLVEDEPSREVREKEGLKEGDTLLGYYHGIPTPMRGDWYGMGTTFPDTITLYRIPIEEEAETLSQRAAEDGKTWPSGPERRLKRPAGEEYVRQVIRETIWHEVAHHFGMDEGEVGNRERKRDEKRPH